MYFKILKKDVAKKKVITLAVFVFIMLSAFFLASGTNMIVNLYEALGDMFEKAKVPHFVQYHSGDVDQQAINKWNNESGLVRLQQTSKMINIHGSNIFFNHSEESLGIGVMETLFVSQNKHFDYLLDLESNIISLKAGEISVPIYFMQKNGLKIGDTVRIKRGNYSNTFTIKTFVRDAQMNPSIVSSKRFVVSNGDFKELEMHFRESEFQISYLLKDRKLLSEFSHAYSMSSLPKKGPTIDYQLLIALNSLTDGLLFSVILVISILLNIIAILCLRFTIISTLEEDYQEIGVMKAIGFKQSQIKRVYLTKYAIVAGLACVTGYLLSLFFNLLFSSNILLYVGHAELSIFQSLLPLLITGIVFLVIMVFCNLTLNRFKRISAIEALRMGNTGETYTGRSIFSLYKTKRLNINVAIGLRDVVLRLKTYGLLFFVFFVCTFIVIVPLNFYNTIKSDDFITYMGMGRSDILIDLRQTEDINQRYNEVLEYIKNDSDVEKFSALVTSKFKVIDDEGLEEGLLVETGDFTIFPLSYSVGSAPILENEIALSYLTAQGLDKVVGDRLNMIVEGQEKMMLITGIYQDITNGGKTAKAAIKPNYETAAWYMINVDLKTGMESKILEYTKLFKPAKITDMQGYISETFGNTIQQLGFLIIVAIILAIVVAYMITALFIKMLIAKDHAQISIMKRIGFPSLSIRLQYVTKALLVLVSGLVLGAVASNTIGKSMIGILLRVIGVSKISFVINPLQAYILCPLILIITVIIAIFSSTKSINYLTNTEL